MANKIMDHVTEKGVKVFKKMASTSVSELYEKFKEKLNDKESTPYIIIGGLLIVVFYVVYGYAGQVICGLVGVAYPAYFSIKAIETKATVDDTKWLTYWVLFSCLEVFEKIFAFVTNFIPLYWVLKCAFYIWCMAPIKNYGVNFLYGKVRTWFLEHESAIDALLTKFNEYLDKAQKYASKIITMKKD